ncbi:MAG: hypothetical protein IKX86_04605 [Clostridia bacterium]|nr:hypothetical protein [Clostridia bacterium]MBR5767933.1 hypothetical protein [Clostridia bacterium]
MDIKEMITSVVGKISDDSNLLAKFKKNPSSVVKSLLSKLGISKETLTKDLINKVVEGVKAKLGIDTATSLLGKLSGLFGKK